MIRIEGNALPGFIDKAVGWHPAAIGIARRGIFRAGVVVVVAHHDFLMARPQRQQYRVIKEPQRVAQQIALSARARRGQWIGEFSAGKVGRRRINVLSRVDIGRCPGQRHVVSVFSIGGQRGIADIDLMRNEASRKMSTQARHTAHIVLDMGAIERAEGRVAVAVRQLRRAVVAGFVRMLRAESCIGGPVVAQVILRLRDTEFRLHIAVHPFLAVVMRI